MASATSSVEAPNYSYMNDHGVWIDVYDNETETSESGSDIDENVSQNTDMLSINSSESSRNKLKIKFNKSEDIEEIQSDIESSSTDVDRNVYESFVINIVSLMLKKLIGYNVSNVLNGFIKYV